MERLCPGRTSCAMLLGLNLVVAYAQYVVVRRGVSGALAACESRAGTI